MRNDTRLENLKNTISGLNYDEYTKRCIYQYIGSHFYLSPSNKICKKYSVKTFCDLINSNNCNKESIDLILKGISEDELNSYYNTSLKSIVEHTNRCNDFYDSRSENYNPKIVSFGGKPYKCLQCGKEFYVDSVKLWVYKDKKTGRPYCSYSCKNKGGI